MRLDFEAIFIFNFNSQLFFLDTRKITIEVMGLLCLANIK
jgi:hypothetical protein